MIIACNIRSHEKAEDAFSSRMQKIIKDNFQMDSSNALFLDIDGEGNVTFPNLEDRSKKISNALIQLIIEKKNGSSAKEYIDKNLNKFSTKISNLRPNVSLKIGNNANNINCRECKGIILFGFALGAVCAYMTGAYLSKELNIPISIVAFDPIPENTGFTAKFSNSIYQSARNLDLSKVFTVTTILTYFKNGAKPIDSWVSIALKQMLPKSLKNRQNSNVILTKRTALKLERTDINNMLRFYAVATYLFFNKTHKKSTNTTTLQNFITFGIADTNSSHINKSIFFDNLPNHTYAEDSSTLALKQNDLLRNREYIPLTLKYIKDKLIQDLKNYCNFQFFGWHHNKKLAQNLIKELQKDSKRLKIRAIKGIKQFKRFLFFYKRLA